MKRLAQWLRRTADRLDPTSVQQAGNIIEDYMRRASDIPTLTNVVSNAELVTLDRGAALRKDAEPSLGLGPPLSTLHDASGVEAREPALTGKYAKPLESGAHAGDSPVAEISRAPSTAGESVSADRNSPIAAASPKSNVARIHATKPTTFSRRKSPKPKPDPDPGEAA